MFGIRPWELDRLRPAELDAMEAHLAALTQPTAGDGDAPQQ